MSKKRTIHESSEEEEIECATDKDSESEMSYGYGMEVPDSAIEWTQPGTDPEGFPFPPRKPSSLARNERGKAHICKNCHFYLKEPRLKKLNPSSGKLEHVCPFKCTDYRTCYTRRVALHPEMDEEYNRLFSSYKQQCKELKETKSKTAVTSKAHNINLRLFPKYSPELNPIEQVFATIKNRIRNTIFELPMMVQVLVELSRFHFIEHFVFYLHSWSGNHQ